MAVNRPTGDNARKGAVKKRTQRATKTMGKSSWTKRNKSNGEFIDVKVAKKKFKGVRKEKPAAKTKTAKKPAVKKAKKKTVKKKVAKKARPRA